MNSGLVALLRGRVPEFARFAAVGGLATLVHAAVYLMLLQVGMDPQLANVAGFVSALGISILGHHHFTFRAEGKRDLTASSWRLVVAALLGYLINAFFVYLVADVLKIAAGFAIVPMIGVTPLVTYFINRKWVFYGKDADVAPWLFALAVGAAVFLLFGGASSIVPTNTSWLMRHDPSQHYMGWAFFRDTPLFQFPLGATPLFGDKIASSIVFSDSIPLFALPFKLVSPLLPHPFQYFGLWIAFCLCMQAYFALRILRQLDVPVVAAGVGAVLFVLSPIMLWRLHGHEALLAHWLLLAGVSLYLEPRWRGGAWLALLVAAVLVHAYLFAMVGGIWFADLCGRWLGWHGERRPRLAAVVAPLVVCPLVAWAVGYFMAPSAIGLTAWGAGFGLYRAELLALVDPDEIWSGALPDVPDGIGGDAGFAYLGLGVLALIVPAVASWLGARRFGFSARYRALAALAVLFSLFALSNRVGVLDTTVLTIPLPSLLDPLLVAFRASGRFIWVPAYLIMLLLVVSAARWPKPRQGVAVLLAAVALQVFDLQPAMSFFRTTFSATWQNPAQSGFWSEAVRNYRRIALVPADSEGPVYLPMAMLAAENGLAINVAYLARHDPEALEAERAEVLAAVTSGALDPDTLYVFSDDGLFRKALSSKPGAAFGGAVDGFKVLAPGWNGCTATCGATTLSP
ncbi:DUF6311 domain-containing protein [Arvimicrobium flavum]|uniref:DUF6311 domain-containing protein n=1 Tax=Arvimicrobium flavum TaxID=3393320 RepID=UPI00237BB3D2|nr:DUF6311 domain-containing protein [Mesorhizobium shangrilense]